MRLTIVILLAAMLQASAETHAQHISLDKSNATLIEILLDIRKQTDYDFLYSKPQLSDAKRISIKVNNAPITEVLDRCFKDQPFTYSIDNRTITIKRKATKVQESKMERTSGITIKGKVTDSLGNPLVGATVKVKSEARVVSTDVAGSFTIVSENNGGVLVVSYLGYARREIAFSETDNGPFVIVLKEDKSSLDAITVISTGYQTLPKERATGAFTQIDEKTLNRNVGINILDRLEGLASGLILNRGLPGNNNPKIAVRGRSTIFANPEPTIVLDGFPYEGTIDQINPADISSITLLKDAAAASIWGAKASNGVIVITTKNGNKNQKLQVELSSVVTVAHKPDLYYKPQISSSDYIDLEQFLFDKGFYNGILNLGYSTVSAAVEIFNRKKNNEISASEAEEQINPLRANDIRLDLARYSYRPSFYQQHQLNLRGGGENNRYYVSGGYDRNLESIVSDSYDRLTLKANNTFSFFREKLEISSNINFVSAKTNSNADNYVPYSPYDRMVDYNGNALPVVKNLRTSYTENAGNGKLLDWLYRPKNELVGNTLLRQDQYRIKLGINYRLMDGLNITANYQYLKENNIREIDRDISSYYTRNLINTYTVIAGNNITYGLPKGNILNTRKTDILSKIIRFQANYNKQIAEGHNISAIAGYEGGDTRNTLDDAVLYGYDPSTMTNANNAINPLVRYPVFYSPGSTGQILTAPIISGTTNISQSFYANASYTYKGRYIFSGSARRDESNLFGVKTNQKGVPLWSSGFAWIISKENFYALDWLSLLKLRLTYGYNGNVDKSTSGLLTVYNGGLTNEFGSVYSTILNPPNPLLRWEKVKTWNIGLDYEMVRSRITGSIDIYQKNAVDLIGNNPIAMQSGVTQFRGNGADLQTRGIDFLLTTRNLIDVLKWNTSFIFNYNLDKVTNYKIKQVSNYEIIWNNIQNPLEGYPYYAIYSFPSAGLDASGNPQGYLNGTVSKDYAAIISKLDPNQIKYHGSASPKYFGSVMNSFGYKNFDLSFNVTYKLGYYFRRSDVFTGNADGIRYQMADYEKRWKNTGDELTTNIPALIYPSNSSRGTFFQYSEELVEKADHIRLQDIRLAYNFSDKNLERALFKNISIFLYAKNIGIIWRANRQDLDPDYGTSAIPQPFSTSFGLNLSF